MIILTELETINRFRNLDKMCGYIGLVPSTKSSGEKERTGDITPRGHNVLTNCNYRKFMDSNKERSIINEEVTSHYCKRMDQNKAIVKIAKKLLSRIRFVLTQ